MHTYFYYFLLSLYRIRLNKAEMHSRVITHSHMSYTYPEKFRRDNVIAPFYPFSVVMVTLPVSNG